MPDLVVVVPSRGRPDNAKKLARAFVDTCTAGSELLFAVDSDDPTLGGYSGLIRNGPVDLSFCGPWVPMVPKLNKVAVQVAASVDAPFAVAFMGDDHRPRTEGWDTAILAALRELGTGVVYGNDLLQGEALCTAWAMTSDIVRTLRRMVPAPVEHMFCDNAVMDLAKAAKCLRYLPGVVIEHLHPLAGKADWDPGYWRVNRPEQYQRDGDVYQTFLAVQFADDVAAVAELREVASCP